MDCRKLFRVFVCVSLVSWAALELSGQNKGYRFYSGPCRLEDFPLNTPLFPVKGRVIDDLTGAGIAGATVRLDSTCLPDSVQALADRMRQETVTDEDGKFSFRDLPKISVNIAANKGNDYLEPWSFRRHADDLIRMHTIAPDLEPIILRIAPAASISGIVRDKEGTPVGDAWVSLWTYGTWEGWPRLEFLNAEKTNPDGSYRRGQLPPGQYYLIVSPDPYHNGVPFAHDENGNPVGIVPVRFPPQPEDVNEDPFLNLAEGQHLKVDFRLVPTIVHRVSGRIEGRARWGVPLDVIGRNGIQYFCKAPPLCCGFETWVPNGKFRFSADAMSADGSFTTSQAFEVHDADLTDVVVPIAARSETSIPIQVAISPSRKPSCLETHMGCAFLYVWLIRHLENGYFSVGSQSVTLLQPGRDGAFRTESLVTMSGTYSVIVSTSLNVYAESIVRNSTDLMLEPLVVKPGDSGNPIQVVLAEGATIEGATIASGKPAKAWVYAIPETSDGRLFHAITSDAQGKFRLEGLAAAEYSVFATDIELGINLRNPKEVEYWKIHGQHIKPQIGTLAQVVLQETPVPAELYPREAPPRR